MPKLDRPSRVKFQANQEEPPAEPQDDAKEVDYAALDAAMELPAEDTTEPATEEAPAEEAPVEDTTEEEPTRESDEARLKGLTLAELKAEAKGDYDLPSGGTKPALIKRILNHLYPEATKPTTSGATEEEIAAEVLSAATAAEAEPAKTGRKRNDTRRTPNAKRATRTDLLFVPLEETEEYSRVLYYGREGSAKTTNLLAAGNLGRVLLINAEGGIKKRALAAQGIDISQVSVWPPDGQEITYEALRDVYFQVKSDLEDDPSSWFLVGFDSITDITQGILDQVGNHRTEKKINSGYDVSTVDSFFVDRDDYGTMAKMVRKLMRDFRDLPVHVVYTALERRDVDEDTGAVAYGPAVSPAVGTDLMGYVDLVLYCRAADEEQDVFRAVTKRAGKYRVKDRDGMLPRVLVNPKFPRILSYLDGSLTEDTDEEQTKLKAKPVPEEKPKAKGRTRAPRTTTKNTKTEESN